MATTSVPPIDMNKLNAFVGQAVGDLGAALHAALIVIGDRLGLYRAMADSQPVTSTELAQKTGTSERYVREWLNANAASGYVHYDAESRTYRLPPEQAFALAVDNTPVHLPGAFLMVELISHERFGPDYRKIPHRRRFWMARTSRIALRRVRRFFRPNYLAHLMIEWMPALDGVEAKLKNGGSVADIGCGHGASLSDGAGALKFEIPRIRLSRGLGCPRREAAQAREDRGPDFSSPGQSLAALNMI